MIFHWSRWTSFSWCRRTGLDRCRGRGGPGRGDGTGGFGAVIVAVCLLGVVGLELTEEMFALRIDDLLLLDIRVD